jgi:GNAT superfamily N-acetyltransferase
VPGRVPYGSPVLTIDEIDTATAPEQLLVELAAFYRWVYADEHPDDPPRPTERQVLDWRSIGSHELVPRWTARRDGEIIGSAVAWMGLTDNLDRGFGRVFVHPAHRRGGVGRALGLAVLDRLAAGGRTRVGTYVVAGGPSEPVCERLGMRQVYEETHNRLVAADLDRSLMEAWIAQAPERASGYHLLELTDPFADELLEPWCELQFQMNTAPMEDMEREDEVMTPAMWRDIEARLAPARKTLRTVIAVETETGAFAGSTTLQVDLLDPTHAWQWETVTHPDHRNRGLGRWMKATNVLRVVDEFGVERIDTENAGSNEPMLNINRTMGFRTVLVTHSWEGELAVVAERLGA